MPTYREEPLQRYIDDASAGQPTPGGGSVSALAGALGATMAAMAANFTVGKKKFKDVEPQVRALLDQIVATRDELLDLMQADTEAYAAVSAAYGMPKETPEQKAARTEAIQQALRTAMDPPLRSVRACARLVRLAAELVDVANPNLISDVGVAAVLAEAALRGAKLNVDINLAYLKDAATVQQTRQEVEQLLTEAQQTTQVVLQKVEKAIGA